MEIKLSNEVCSLFPDFKIGAIFYDDIAIGESPQMLKGRLQLFQESLFFDLEDKAITDLEGIQEWRKIFKAAGKDPNRYRHSAEALYRRVQKQNFLSPVHSAIDLNNFYSLQYQVPIGIYDCKNLSDALTLRIGKEGEEYTGLNGRSNSLEGLIILADSKGAFGSPFVDSVRAPITPETTNAVQIIFLRPSMDMENSHKLTESLMEMFIKIHGGTASYKIIGCH